MEYWPWDTGHEYWPWDTGHEYWPGDIGHEILAWRHWPWNTGLEILALRWYGSGCYICLKTKGKPGWCTRGSKNHENHWKSWNFPFWSHAEPSTDTTSDTTSDTAVRECPTPRAREAVHQASFGYNLRARIAHRFLTLFDTILSKSVKKCQISSGRKTVLTVVSVVSRKCRDLWKPLYV